LKPRFKDELYFGETRTLTFDFSPDLAAGVSLTGIPSVHSINVTAGEDTNPSGMIGIIQLSGNTVLVQVNAQVPHADYDIAVQCPTTSSDVTICPGLLSVRKA
jgi:hypothetical protein